ncbi:MAG: rubredoxin [Christensenella sp.]|nr:rubredoxin [Christensenella sp.]
MAIYICTVCGYTYDESKGIPDAGIAPGTKWDMLPEDWVCPLCGAAKSDFALQDQPKTTAVKTAAPSPDVHDDMQELSPCELSALCTNLARGCEKQYKMEEAGLFSKLADYFQASSKPAQDSGFEPLLALVEKDLAEGLPNASAVASDVKDRGALRALVWNEKVTRILKSLLTRYGKEGDAMLAKTGVFVCSICGFVFIGDTPPAICPVCKAPDWKFVKAEGR